MERRRTRRLRERGHLVRFFVVTTGGIVMKEERRFTEGGILGPLMRFALPVLFALFLQAMYGAVDLFVVGKFAAPEDVSAVSTGSQIMLTLGNLVSSLAMWLAWVMTQLQTLLAVRCFPLCCQLEG